jgi:Flp pilus assembly protein TadB
MTEPQPIILKHQMPAIWYILCISGAVLCWTGIVTSHSPILSIIGLLIVIPCLIWYTVSLRRLRKLARRIEDR